jgi:hypothetical protein
MDRITTAIMDHIHMDFTRGPRCSAEMVNAISRKSWDFEADRLALEEFRTVR